VSMGTTFLNFTEVVVGEPGPSATFSSILNTWAHIAVSRSSGTTKLFLNGSQVASAAQTTNFNNTSYPVYIATSPAESYIPAYISNLRILKGTGLYTASFTVPTSPLTAITNTSLLTCQSATIIDNSTNNFTITNNNGATVSSIVTPFTASRSVFKIKKNNPNPTMLTGYGASFNGSNNIQTPSNAAFGFGTGDWTIEGWFYSANTGRLRLWSCSDNTDNFDQNTGGDIGYYNGSTTVWTGAGAVTSSTWYHFAAVRSSGTVTIYKNGTSILTQASTPNSSARYINIGGAVNTTYNGYISNFRVLKGTALYTSSFTPPTTPLTAIASCSLLTCNTATFVDSSTNNFTLTNNSGVVASSSFTPFSSSLIAPTNYSTLFNGSSTWLTTPSTSSLAIGTGDFTYECWAYLSSTPGQYNSNAMSSFVQNSAGDHGTYIGFTSTLTAFATLKLDNSTSLTLNSGATTYALNTWHHVVLSRVGTTVSLFINGSRVATNTNSYNLIESIVAIGKQYSTTESGVNGFTNVGVFSGYISNARVVIGGTQPYSPTSSTLTVPTTPLTAITNTKLLTCNAATIVDGSTNNLTITNTGAATVSSTITPFSASVSNSGFKLKQVSYVRPNYMIATGGDLITTSGGYKIHTFTTVGTSSFTISSLGESPSIEYLVIGGGGGGGYVAGAYDSRGGGGGAGGFRTGSVSSGFTTSSYSIIVGSGGSLNNNGENSSFLNVTSLGGGGGGFGSTAAKTGGSGGGGGAIGSAGNYSGAAGTAGQGNSGGGGGTDSSTYRYGGGGGGAGSVGVTAINSSTACVGGSGSYSNITGTNTPYAGGGGGGQHAGGIGGGGAGTTTGSANTGGGGGGGYTTYQYANYPGGAGGSGVVILKYRYTT